MSRINGPDPQRGATPAPQPTSTTAGATGASAARADAGTSGPAAVPGRPNDPTTLRFPGLGERVGDQGDTEEPVVADQATLDALRPGTALLVVLRGPNTGARFLLDADTVTSGRHPSSDIFLDDVTVSRKHATFRRQRGSFVVTDVGSLNGTYVNRRRIDQAQLQAGDEVQIGKFRLVFYAGQQPGRGE